MLRSHVAALLALLLVAGHATRAHGDVEETERRLKTAGIDAKLRADIHRAIDKAVVYLLAHQAPDGSFRGPDDPTPLQVGVTTLCAFALRHAGTPAAREGASKSLAWLFPSERDAKDALEDSVYEAGLALLLLHADRSGPAHVARIARALAAGQDAKTGWWSYRTGSGAGGARAGSARWAGLNDLLNLSTTQFAALGLWAATRADPARRVVTWRRHLEAQLDFVTPDGSWPYVPHRWQIGPTLTAMAGGWQTAYSYPAGTYMGLANLVLAEAALGTDDPLVRARETDLRATRASAEGALYRHARWTLGGYPDTEWPFYSLYALEKACVFLGVERIQDLAWYGTGAERLVALQAADGGWSKAAWARGRVEGADRQGVVDTAFALLFLLRTSETTRPHTPSPVDTPKPAALTGGAGGAPPDAPGAPPDVPPPAQRVPLSRAWTLLARLQELIDDPRSEDAEILAALDQVAEAAGRLAPDPGAEIAFGERVLRWRAELEAALLAAFALVRPGPGREENLRGPVNQRAAERLARSGPAISARMRDVLERVHLGAEPQASASVLGAGFDALALQGEPASATWLAQTVLDTDLRWERVHRTERVLRALARFETLPGPVRRDAFERILRAFESVEAAHDQFRVGGGRPPAASPASVKLVQRHTYYAWEWLRYDAILALHALAGDTPERTILRNASGERLVTLKAIRPWFEDHKSPHLDAWR